MRALALALTVAVLAVPAAAARGPASKIAYVHGRAAQVIYVDSALRQPIVLPHTGVPHWSGDGRLVSFGGYIVAGRVDLPTADLSWAPTGERAAYVTKDGGVGIWTPRGRRAVLPGGWGASAVASSADGALAIGRAVCKGACGLPAHTEVWVWRNGSLRLIARTDGGRPVPFAWHNGHVLWWDWPNSASIAADGVALYEDEKRIAAGLMFPDYVAVCGRHLAVTAGGDRFTTSGKRILFDGRDVSRDRARSWVAPTCTAGGRLVAAAGRNWEEPRFGSEHRALWQLLPARRRLTHPPAGWTDEYPHVLPNGDVLFVRTQQIPFRRNGQWWTTTRGRLELLRGASLRRLHELTITGPDIGSDFVNYYGHYDWPSRLAFAP
ncbi:MAG: hypothetical protein AUG91_02670 [Actinobacteria bacterium 13_1_20CM_4_69_9]|nr:MAG: hypothetical protein AUG91_02670 [Actinobacteria bacterium 13_1_20CM_4_69_9]